MSDIEPHRTTLLAEEAASNLDITTPLPWSQLSIIVIMRLAEPIAFTLVMPFVGDMIWDLKATDDRANLGLYAGLEESVFAAVQTLTVLHWSRASDRLGRKPVLLVGLCGCAISTLLLGLSTSFTMLVITRSLNGALNGNVAILPSVVGELTDRINSAKAFSFLPFSWVLGSAIGPILGGYLSQPSKKYPSIFSLDKAGPLAFYGLWDAYPYFLPCAVSALITLISIIVGALFLKETLPSKVKEEGGNEQASSEQTPLLSSSESPYGSTATTTPFKVTAGRYSMKDTPVRSENYDECDSSLQEMTIMQLININHVRLLVSSLSLLSLSLVAIDAVQVLYFWEPISLGGLSFPSQISGSFFSIAGLMGVFLHLYAFPILQRRVGTLRLYKSCIYAFLLVPLTFPLANIAATCGFKGGEEHEGGFEDDIEGIYKVVVLVLVTMTTAMRMFVSMGYSCNMILLNEASNVIPGVPLGMINGLAQMASSLMRAIGPYAASTLYALTLDERWTGGYLIWIVLFVIGMGGAAVTYNLEDVYSEAEDSVQPRRIESQARRAT